MKMVFLASIIRHKSCILYVFFDFFVQKSLLNKNYLCIAAIIVTTRGPLYTWLVWPLFYNFIHRIVYTLSNAPPPPEYKQPEVTSPRSHVMANWSQVPFQQGEQPSNKVPFTSRQQNLLHRRKHLSNLCIKLHKCRNLSQTRYGFVNTVIWIYPLLYPDFICRWDP